MSEVLKGSAEKNPDTKRWENLDLGLAVEQRSGRIENETFEASEKQAREELDGQKKRAAVLDARAAVLRSYNDGSTTGEFEQFERQQEAGKNREEYGENITAEAARRCFSKEFVTLGNKFEKVRRAEEKEKGMSAKDSQKSYKRRLKEGIVMTDEEKKHLSEMNRMSDSQREEYGREKRREYMCIQEKREAHPMKFGHLMRKHRLSAPKEWDDPNYSLGDLRRINSALILLDDKK